MRDSLRKVLLAGLWLALALAVPCSAPLAAQDAYVTQWTPTESEMAALESTYVGDVELPGDANWTWFVYLEASASQVLVAPPEHFSLPYQVGYDYDGYVQNDTLQMNFQAAGVYAVTIHYKNLGKPSKTYMVFAGAKKQKPRCNANDPKIFGTRQYVPPAHDLYLVDATPDMNGYLDCARAVLNGEVNVANWNDIKTAINNRQAALRRPITVFTLSHGDVSLQIPAPNFTLFNNNPNVQTLTAAAPVGVRGKVSQYNTFSCCTGKDINNPPAGGPHLLDALAGGLSVLPGLRARASGWDRVTVCWGDGIRPPSLYVVRGAVLNVR